MWSYIISQYSHSTTFLRHQVTTAHKSELRPCTVTPGTSPHAALPTCPRDVAASSPWPENNPARGEGAEVDGCQMFQYETQWRILGNCQGTVTSVHHTTAPQSYLVDEPQGKPTKKKNFYFEQRAKYYFANWLKPTMWLDAAQSSGTPRGSSSICKTLSGGWYRGVGLDFSMELFIFGLK